MTDPPLRPGEVVLLRAEVLRVFVAGDGAYLATLRVADCTAGGRYVALASAEALLIVQPEAPNPFALHEDG